MRLRVQLFSPRFCGVAGRGMLGNIDCQCKGISVSTLSSRYFRQAHKRIQRTGFPLLAQGSPQRALEVIFGNG